MSALLNSGHPPASAKIFKLLSLGRRRSRLDQVWPRLIRFGNLTVEISIVACPIVPRYINGHAILLNPLPSGLVVKQPFGAANGASEIFARDWPELNSCRYTCRDGHLVGVDNGVR